MGRSTGLEPAPLGTTNRCSNQLSYDRHYALARRARPLRFVAGYSKRGAAAMVNDTMRKFGFPETLVRDYRHWVVLVRPAQVTLGSLVLCAKSEVERFGALEPAAFAELAEIVPAMERALKLFFDYDRINYLMLMMVDRQVHFHIIPRYAGPRSFGG